MYIILFFLFTVLYYRQSIGFEGRYPSDLITHIQMGIEGYAFGLFLVFIISVHMLYNNWIDKNKFQGSKNVKVMYITIGVILFSTHLISGIYYFLRIMSGKGYF